MKEKTKAFYKATFKFWVKEKLIQFAITFVLVFAIGFIHYAFGWNMGYTAVFLITWQKVKKVWSDKDNV